MKKRGSRVNMRTIPIFVCGGMLIAFWLVGFGHGDHGIHHEQDLGTGKGLGKREDAHHEDVPLPPSKAHHGRRTTPPRIGPHPKKKKTSAKRTNVVKFDVKESNMHPISFPLCSDHDTVKGLKPVYTDTANIHLGDKYKIWDPQYVHHKGGTFKLPGRYCAAVVNEDRNCLEEASVFAVISGAKKGTEYGVMPAPRAAPFSYITSVAELALLKVAQMKIRVVAPFYLPPQRPVPIFVRVEGETREGRAPWVRMPFLARLREMCGDADTESATFPLHRGATALWGIPAKGTPLKNVATSRPHFDVTPGPSPGFFCMDFEGAEGGERISGPLPQILRSSRDIKVKTISWKEALPLFDSASGRHKGEAIYVVNIQGKETIPAGSSVKVPPGAVLLLGDGAEIHVKGALMMLGSTARPVVMLPEDPDGAYNGIQVFEGGRLVMKHVIASGSGTVAKRLKDTGKHRKEHPLVSSLGTVEVEELYAMQLHGPGFGLGQGETTVRSTTLIGLQQGGECVFCAVTLQDTYISSLPNDERETFTDGDNDGFYFRGGRAKVDGLVVVNSKDDCIDTASSKDSPGGSLDIKNTLLEHCSHEGIALSGSVMEDPRTVHISHTVIRKAQQGIEVGYSPASHSATMKHCALLDNVIGVKFGDNYGLQVAGKLAVSNTLFQGNHDDVLNLVKLHNEHHPERLRITHSVLSLNHTQRYCGGPQWSEGSHDGASSNAVHTEAHPLVDPLTLAVLSDNGVVDQLFEDLKQ